MRVMSLVMIAGSLLLGLAQMTCAITALDSCMTQHPNLAVNSVSSTPFNIHLEYPSRYEIPNFRSNQLQSPNAMLLGSRQTMMNISFSGSLNDRQLFEIYLAQVVVPGIFNSSDGDLLLSYMPVGSKVTRGKQSSKELITLVLPLKGEDSSSSINDGVDSHVQRTLQNLLGQSKTGDVTTSASSGSGSGGDTTPQLHLFSPFQFIHTGDLLHTFQTTAPFYPCTNDAISGRYILHGRKFTVLQSTLDTISQARRSHEKYAALGFHNTTVPVTSFVAEVTGSQLPSPTAPSVSSLNISATATGQPLVIHHNTESKLTGAVLFSMIFGLSGGAVALFIWLVILFIENRKQYSRWYEDWLSPSEPPIKYHGKERKEEHSSSGGGFGDGDDEDDGDGFDEWDEEEEEGDEEEEY